MYYNGEGTTKNFKKAIEWFTKSAEQGHAYALENLAAMYFNGLGATKNYQKAYTHFLICDYLEYKQDTVKESINELEQKLSPQAIEDAQNEAEKMIQSFKR